MDTNRRDFLKKAALFSGGLGLWGALPSSIQKAMAINPEMGSTFYDAEHVVILMQENRSFDHCFGKLKGVRGFNDPRAIRLPDKNLVWMQSDREGNTFTPFRLNLKDTKATWMRDIPHSWENQVDARNGGKHNGWIEAKRSGRDEFKHVPMTMGFYDREDLPFYYAFADAFTICDQHFCAALTGTTTNRNYLWAGKTHGKPGEKPLVRNGEHTYGKEVDWKTFPDRLQENEISWKVYQNEVSVGTLLEGEDESWLANFTDNNLEWFNQFNVRFTPGHFEFLKHHQQHLPIEIGQLEEELKNAAESEKTDIQKTLMAKKKALASIKKTIRNYNPETFEQLSAKEKELHKRAFTTNIADPHYHHTEILEYMEEGEKRSTKIPKGDIFHEFRKDVEKGELPTVSWLVAPQKFSDHPSAPWYGAWYVSEALEILTKDPELWKKTIFILNYDENDGYFDHVPPFVPPKPGDPSSGKISDGLDATGEYVTLEQELNYPGMNPENARESPVGLGYRVPLIVASPWSRGGWVNSEVCDITSTILFLETFLSHKTGKIIKEDNISTWRRNVCGDLTSVFRPYYGEKIDLPDFVDFESHVKEIYNAGFKDLPNNFKALSKEEILQINQNPSQSPWIPKQEPGTKPSNALNYELYVDGGVDPSGKNLKLNFISSDKRFGKKALGAPFMVYAPIGYRNKDQSGYENYQSWAFTVKPGDQINYEWPLNEFEGDIFHLIVYGPNGFFREIKGRKNQDKVSFDSEYFNNEQLSAQGDYHLKTYNMEQNGMEIIIEDNAYGGSRKSLTLKPKGSQSIIIPTGKSHGWYDFSVLLNDDQYFLKRYAGRIEMGQPGITDPLMGKDLPVELVKS
ncbi:MAG: phospholipase C, phosphocholine-specific [Cyclobacteriaceae bacterium]